MPKIAKLAIQSGLPQLDRLFDYLVPATLQDKLQVGNRVKVNFGKSKKPLDGFVVELAESSEFEGKLSEVLSVVGESPALKQEIFSLCSQLAERSATSLGELLKIAVPAHMPRAFASHENSDTKAFSLDDSYNAGLDPEYVANLVASDARSFCLAEPKVLSISRGVEDFQAPSWVRLFLAVAQQNLAAGKSTIVLVPDFREHATAVQAFNDAGLARFVSDYSAELPKSKQYLGFLRALEPSPHIIIGSRSAAFAPAHNLGSILMFDEADRSYVDQGSPYLHTRDVVLVRQSIQNCSLVFASHSVSTDAARLIETGHLKDRSLLFAAPRISISEPGMRVDSHAFKAIRDGLAEGPVLVQVSSLGDSTAIYCKKCDEPATCKSCTGPLWIDGSGVKKCRWCNGFSMDHKCTCGSSEFALGRAGSTRTAAELGRAFPNARVIESTGENRLVSIPRGRTLVIATAGAEPYVDGGYSAVVLLDAKVLLGRQNLRAQEEAVRVWSNAVAKVKASGPCVLVGVAGELAKLFSLWNHLKIADGELASRQELGLPPAVRMGSVTAPLAMLEGISEALGSNTTVTRIGPAPVASNPGSDLWRLIFKYPYAQAQTVARLLKVEVARVAAGKTRVSVSGRSTRAVTIKMNDAEVV